MSITAMTNVALARRLDFEPQGRAPDDLEGVAHAAGAVPAPLPAAGAPAAVPPAVPAGGAPAPVPPAAPAAPAQSNANTALQTLTTYIPTEVLTLYVAAVAALSQAPTGAAALSQATTGPHAGPWPPFYIFLVGTPLIVWLTFATKLKSAGRALPVLPRTWPVWEMCAATLAFSAWAFALPETPFARFTGWYRAPLAGLVVLLVSYGLGALAPLMKSLRTA